MGLLILPFILIFRINGRLQTYFPYVGRNSSLRAMYRLARPQATKTRLAFLSNPRYRTLLKPNTREHQERVLHLRPHLRLGPVLRSIFIRQWARTTTFLVGKVLL